MREIGREEMRFTPSKALLLALLFLSVLAGNGSANASSATATTISCTPTTLSVGSSTTCTVTVSGYSGSITGETVSIAMSGGTGNIATTGCALSGGTCSTAVQATGVGTPTIQAAYGGDSGNTGSSGTTSVTITQATTTTHISCVASSDIVGSADTCSATIGNGYSVSGTVSWTTSGQGQFAPANPCSLSSGTCSVNYTPTQTGTVQITGTYSGDTNNAGSSSSYTLTVSKYQSTTVVNCNPQTVIVGSLATCTATVTGYAPTGTVAWTNTGTGTFSSKSCTLSGSSTGSCQVTFTPQNSATITATYNGDSNNLGSLGTFQVNAIVSRYLQFTVDNAGPPVSIALSGCSVSPTSVTANGTAQIVHADPGCGPITATLPVSVGSTRYVGPSGVTSFAINSCSSSSCQVFTATIYYQLQNTYQATPYYPSAWTSTGSVTVTGTFAGAGGATVCTIQFSGGTGPSLCQGWSDFSRPASISDLAISANQRWSTTQATYTDSAGNSFHNADYYLQWLEGFQYSLVGSTSAPSAPVLSYTTYGSSTSFMLQKSLTRVWLDSASTWTAPQLLAGSTLDERWAAGSNSGSVTPGQNVTVSYYHQFFETLGYSVVGGPSGSSPPSANLSLFGAQTKFQLANQTARQFTWADAGTIYNFTNPLPGTTTTARWSAPLASGAINSSAVLAPTYYYQYAFSIDFAVVGGGPFHAPQLNLTSFGAEATATLDSTATTYWLDSGSRWSVSMVLPNSTMDERWMTPETTSGAATATADLAFQYYHQFLVKVEYQVLGGGAPVTPTYGYFELGNETSSALSTTLTSFWVDSGSAWNATATLNGSASGERWVTTSATTGLVAAPFSLVLSYYHQYYLVVAVNTALGGTFSNSSGWYDSGTRVNLTASADAKWRLEYWRGTGLGSYNGTEATSAVYVSGPVTETAVFYPGVLVASSQGGSIRLVFGSASGVIKEGTNQTLYIPLGENLTLVAIPSSVLEVFNAWSGNVTRSATQASFAVEGPSSVTGTFGLNYTGIAESIGVAGAAVAATAGVIILRRKRLSMRRITPRKKNGWLQARGPPIAGAAATGLLRWERPWFLR